MKRCRVILEIDYDDTRYASPADYNWERRLGLQEGESVFVEDVVEVELAGYGEDCPRNESDVDSWRAPIHADVNIGPRYWRDDVEALADKLQSDNDWPQMP